MNGHRLVTFVAIVAQFGLCSWPVLQRLENLEARVAELEQSQGAIAPALTLSRDFGPEVPKNWVPRSFNGMRYYDVPLNGRGPMR